MSQPVDWGRPPAELADAARNRRLLLATTSEMLATQLTAALDGPLLLYLSSDALAADADDVAGRLARGWEDLVRRVGRP